MIFKYVMFFLTIAFMFGNHAKSSASEGDKLYKLFGTAPKGSKMRPIEAKSFIPFDKKFDQLSERQMRIYRSFFENLKEDETPPFPIEGLIEVYDPLIKGHARIGGVGELLVYSEIDEKGVVQKVTVYKSPTEKLAEIATTVMFNTKFEPATCSGKPCRMDYPFYYDVPLRHRALRSLDKEDFGKGDISTKVE